MDCHFTESAGIGILVYSKTEYAFPLADAISGTPSASKSAMVGGPPLPVPGMSICARTTPVVGACTRSVPFAMTTISGVPSRSRSAMAGYPSSWPLSQ